MPDELEQVAAEVRRSLELLTKPGNRANDRHAAGGGILTNTDLF